MGSHSLAPVKIRSERTTRGILAMLLVMGALAAITITGSGIAGATNLSGGFAPKVYDGKLDINGDGEVTSDDNADIFFPDTEIDEGRIDCNAWTGTGSAETDANTFGAGDGTIDGSDDCLLRANNGASGHYYITVVDGIMDQFTVGSFASGDYFDIPQGWTMPYLYKTLSTMNSSSLTSGVQAAFYAAGGKLSGIATPFGSVTADDCTDGDAYVLNHVGTDGTNDLYILGDTCGDDEAVNGMVDLDEDGDATLGDSCYNGCFWGYNVVSGLIQTERPGDPGVVGTPGAKGDTGAAGEDGVSGRTTVNASSSTNSLNKSKSALCSSTTKVLGGGYVLVGTASTLAHLTVVANGPISGGWRVRVIESTPTSGTWSVDVTAVCAIA